MLSELVIVSSEVFKKMFYGEKSSTGVLQWWGVFVDEPRMGEESVFYCSFYHGDVLTLIKIKGEELNIN